eukprot:3716440-Rhodomonas_salina.2
MSVPRILYQWRSTIHLPVPNLWYQRRRQIAEPTRCVNGGVAPYPVVPCHHTSRYQNATHMRKASSIRVEDSEQLYSLRAHGMQLRACAEQQRAYAIQQRAYVMQLHGST